MVETPVVFFRGGLEREIRAMPLDGVANGPLEPASRQLPLHQIVLRPRLHGLNRHRFVIRVAGGNDRQPRRFGL